MSPFDGTDPQRFITDFFTGFGEEVAHGEEELAAVVDRYHTPDIVQVADGHRMDRDRLIAHARPARKRPGASRMKVHEAMADGDRLAARYTLYVQRGRRDLVIDVYFFGRFAPDGRMREATMLTRMEDSAASGSADASASEVLEVSA
ncbi:nuclear transport factor 2 family protein [Nocardiopsis sp. HUAS JQ3]|uniref:nuclear transport factor 2 family protein n=1 Tax=Nocardiopsis sp. HUAS JQ3 TaxID=3061629 RepID=UPI0023A9863D|nr:nuclear transport factor 2 family protein [Nocardiopsis sp. HUAS JQ3]WDZ91792.1 nuclear transport factor 2 family protein [Nocardiopsis sp. HUAS JQ3]